MANRSPLLNPQPKHRFQESPDNITKHRDLMDGRDYQRAADYGLLQYMARLAGEVKDFNSAAAVGFKVLGAQEILMTMRMLSENPPQPLIVQPQNLDHAAQK